MPNRRPLDNAQIDLGYTTISSPVDGLIGTTKVKAGNLVGRGESTLLVTISIVDPIFFRAGMAEAEYLRLARRAQEQGTVGQGSKIPIQLILADGTTHPHTGRLDVIERNIDPTTGTLAVQMTFPNPERLVRPGQYGRARFEVDTEEERLARAAARGAGTAEPLQHRDRRRRQQGDVPQREGRAARRQPVGD